MFNESNVPRQFYSSNRSLPRKVLCAPSFEPTIERVKKSFIGLSSEQITLLICPSQFRQIYSNIADNIGEKFKSLGLVIDDKKIISGPFEILIKWALTPENSDYDLSKILIVNYRSYCSPSQLLQHIINRCEEILKLENEPEKSSKQKWAKITIFLKNWGEILPRDFQDKELIDCFNSVFQKYASQFAGIAQVQKMIDTAKSKVIIPALEKLGVLNQTEHCKNINELTSEYISEQLSLYEFTLFSNIEIKDFLGQSWTKPNKYEQSPHLCKFLDHFNSVTNWVVSSILYEPDINNRATLISKFIDVAHLMIKDLNFTGFFEIYSGILSSSISRLTKTWDLIKDAHSRMEKLNIIANPSSSYSAYRNYIIENKTKGYIPFMGVIIQDLTFINEGNNDKEDSGNVNFEKCRMIANQLFIIKELQENQRSKYIPSPSFLDFIKSIESHKDDVDKVLYDYSLQVQPRNTN